MNNFDYAINRVLKNEGGLSLDKRDPGGTTNYGISTRFMRSIGGTEKDVIEMSVAKARSIYHRYFWNPKWNTLNRDLAYRLLDLCVNMGEPQSIRLVQRALNNEYIEPLKIDGIYGVETHIRVSQTRALTLISLIRSEATDFYLSLNKPHFLVGWLNRLYDKH